MAWINVSLYLYTGKEALCVIPVKNILGVEKLEESAFNRKNVSSSVIFVSFCVPV